MKHHDPLAIYRRQADVLSIFRVDFLVSRTLMIDLPSLRAPPISTRAADLIIAYDATNEIEKVVNALLNADTSVSTTPDGDSIVGMLNRIWNVIYRHSRFYRYGADGHGGDSHASDDHGGDAGVEAVGGAAGQADDEMDSQLARFNALEEYLEHPEMDIDERIKGVFGV